MSLPMEIIRKIVLAPLDRKDVRSLRLTNRLFGEITAEKLFEDITISYLPHALDGLNKIVASDFWRHQVRNITWVYLGRNGFVIDGTCEHLNASQGRGGRPWVEQLQIIARMPNVETIVLRSSEEKVERYKDSYESRLDFSGAFSPIKIAKLRPKVAWTKFTRLKLWYGSTGDQVAIKMTGAPATIKLNRREGVRYIMQSSLRRVFMSKAYVTTLDFFALSMFYPAMELIRMEYVRLGRLQKDEDPIMPIECVLEHVRMRYRHHPDRSIRFQFKGLSAWSPHTGLFDATEDEVDRWMKGEEDELWDRMKRVMARRPLTRSAARSGVLNTFDREFVEGGEDHFSLDYESDDDDDFGKVA